MAWIDNVEFRAYTPIVDISDEDSITFEHDGSPGGNLIVGAESTMPNDLEEINLPSIAPFGYQRH